MCDVFNRTGGKFYGSDEEGLQETARREAAVGVNCGSVPGTVASEGEEANHANGRYTVGRTEQELKSLALDPAHNGSNRTIDIEKGQHEAMVGLELEERGKLKGIVRDSTGRAEFIDSDGQAWDVKSFNSNYQPNKGGFRLDKAMNTIKKSLADGENVIIDTSSMSSQHLSELIDEIQKQGLINHIIFWP